MLPFLSLKHFETDALRLSPQVGMTFNRVSCFLAHFCTYSHPGLVPLSGSQDELPDADTLRILVVTDNHVPWAWWRDLEAELLYQPFSMLVSRSIHAQRHCSFEGLFWDSFCDRPAGEGRSQQLKSSVSSQSLWFKPPQTHWVRNS